MSGKENALAYAALAKHYATIIEWRYEWGTADHADHVAYIHALVALDITVPSEIFALAQCEDADWLDVDEPASHDTALETAQQWADESPLDITLVYESRSLREHNSQTCPPVERMHILLTTGGPALRLVTDGRRSHLEWQDWGTPWTLLDEPHDVEALGSYYWGLLECY